jgi:hypothetical protein
MTVAIHKMTLAEFLAHDDGTDKLYELENGEIIGTSGVNMQRGALLNIGLSIRSYTR